MRTWNSCSSSTWVALFASSTPSSWESLPVAISLLLNEKRHWCDTNNSVIREYAAGCQFQSEGTRVILIPPSQESLSLADTSERTCVRVKLTSAAQWWKLLLLVNHLLQNEGTCVIATPPLWGSLLLLAENYLDEHTCVVSGPSSRERLSLRDCLLKWRHLRYVYQH